VSGARAPEGNRLSEKLHKDEEKAAVVGPYLPVSPAALQCLELGMSCFGPERELLCLAPGERRSVHIA